MVWLELHALEVALSFDVLYQLLHVGQLAASLSTSPIIEDQKKVSHANLLVLVDSVPEWLLCSCSTTNTVFSPLKTTPSYTDSSSLNPMYLRPRWTSLWCSVQPFWMMETRFCKTESAAVSYFSCSSFGGEIVMTTITSNSSSILESDSSKLARDSVYAMQRSVPFLYTTVGLYLPKTHWCRQ